MKKFCFISKKEIIIFNSLRIFEEERYYALYCPLKSYLALELAIWRRGSHKDVLDYLYLDLFVKIIFSITRPWNWHIGLLKITSLKGQSQAKIIKKLVILFWLLNMTIWCEHVHRLKLQKFF